MTRISGTFDLWPGGRRPVTKVPGRLAGRPWAARPATGQLAGIADGADEVGRAGRKDADMACTLYVAWDDQLSRYDFGPDHPMAPPGSS